MSADTDMPVGEGGEWSNMAIGSAWHDEIFRIYLAILAGVLIFAGVVLGMLTVALRKNVGSVWVTYKGWLFMSPVIVGAILLGPMAMVIFFVLLALVGFKEFARATGLYADWGMTGAVYLAVLAVGATALMRDPNSGRVGWYGLFMALPVFAISAFILVPIARNLVKGQLQVLALAIVGFVYIGWMFLHLAFLGNRAENHGYLFYLLFAVEISDVAAFTFGKIFGRHQLRSMISPNKTWEGAAGALAVSMALPWVMRFSFPQFGTLQLVLTGLIVGIGGQMGDLSMSLIKRDAGIKDMGSIIPGHGGILDRIDSLIFTSPLFLHMVNYFYRQW